MWSPNLQATLGRLLAGLEIVAGDQPHPAVPAVDLGLPPPVILVPEDGEDVALVEAQLLGDGRLVHVECPS